MEGFLEYPPETVGKKINYKINCHYSALIISILYGERGTADLLVFSQVILSMQLSFAVVPFGYVYRKQNEKWGNLSISLGLKFSRPSAELLLF